MSFTRALEKIKAYQEGPSLDLPEIKHALQRAESMEAAFIEHLGIPKVGDHVRMVKRAWSDKERYSYLAAGNTGTIVEVYWHTRAKSFRLGYQPDCEWRYNAGLWLDKEKYFYVHESPGPIHSIDPSYFEVIDPDDALRYSCYCINCNWKGPALATATGSGNYALCPSCQTGDSYRSERLLRFVSPESIPGYAEIKQ